MRFVADPLLAVVAALVAAELGRAVSPERRGETVAALIALVSDASEKREFEDQLRYAQRMEGIDP